MDKEFWQKMDKKQKEISDNSHRISMRSTKLWNLCNGAIWPDNLKEFIDELENRQFELNELCSKNQDLIVEFRELYEEKQEEGNVE